MCVLRAHEDLNEQASEEIRLLIASRNPNTEVKLSAPMVVGGLPL
ncbi:hypothetical protein [Virgibacillus sp. 6R]